MTTWKVKHILKIIDDLDLTSVEMERLISELEMIKETIELKDEKELIELQQYEEKEQYDFDYRQQWAMNNWFNI